MPPSEGGRRFSGPKILEGEQEMQPNILKETEALEVCEGVT